MNPIHNYGTTSCFDSTNLGPQHLKQAAIEIIIAQNIYQLKSDIKRHI